MFCPRRVIAACSTAIVLVWAAQASAQPPVARPQPPPPVTGTTTQAPATAAPAQPAAQPAGQAATARVQPPADANTEQAPTDAMLGVRIYPAAKYLGSYDAGRGQRYYLFGTMQPFAEIVSYYRSELKDKGELVFDVPATHMFDLGRFREEAMAFPPSVTIKDFTWNGSPGYANPKPGVTPTAFPTVIQIVPPETAPAGQIR